MENKTTITVEKKIKDRLEELKGRMTYNEIIDYLIDEFLGVENGKKNRR